MIPRFTEARSVAFAGAGAGGSGERGVRALFGRRRRARELRAEQAKADELADRIVDAARDPDALEKLDAEYLRRRQEVLEEMAAEQRGDASA